jgi:DNA-binding XRE family transcriptional regulator
MSRHTSHTILEKDGVPAFVVLPYEEYLALVSEQDDDLLLPHEVVTAHGLDGKSLIRAWREYKGFTQAQMAARLGVSQSAYAQMERPRANLRAATLKKLAYALEVEVGQLRL